MSAIAAMKTTAHRLKPCKGQLAQAVKELFDKNDRINLYITGLTRSFDEQLYRHLARRKLVGRF